MNKNGTHTLALSFVHLFLNCTENIDMVAEIIKLKEQVRTTNRTLVSGWGIATPISVF